MRSLKLTEEVRLEDGKFGIPRRAAASPLAAKRIYKPRLGLNDISVLSKSCYVRSLSRDKAVIWRMSVKSSDSSLPVRDNGRQKKTDPSRMAHGGLLVLIIFVLLLCASGLGMYLHDRLGERHRTSETKDHVRLVVSILVTFTALVLSLMLSEVKGTFDTFDARLRSFAGDLSNLDIHLREYGLDAEPIRATIRKYVAAAIADSWRNEPAPSGDFPRFDGPAGVERPELGALLIHANSAIHKLDPPDHFRQRLTIRCQIRSTKRCVPGVSCSRLRMIQSRGHSWQQCARGWRSFSEFLASSRRATRLSICRS